MTIDKEKYLKLRVELKRLNGSVQYWKHAINRWQALSNNANKSDRQRMDAITKISFCETKAAEAQKQLDQVKQQITELDPQASRARQTNSNRQMISHQKSIIRKEQQLANQLKAGEQHQASAFHEAQANKAKAKLEQLEQRLAAHLSADQDEKAARRRQLEDEHLAIASAAISFDPYDEQAAARSEARQSERFTDTDLADDDDAPPRH